MAKTKMSFLALACAVAASMACGSAFAEQAHEGVKHGATEAQAAQMIQQARQAALVNARRAPGTVTAPSAKDIADHVARTKKKVLDPLDVNKDDKVTQDEMLSLAKDFAPTLDTNKDGKLERDEIIPKERPVPGQELSAEKKREMMVRMMAFQGLRGQPSVELKAIEQEAGRAFAAMDVNKDGELTVKDIQDHTNAAIARAQLRAKMAQAAAKKRDKASEQNAEYGIAPGFAPGIMPGISPGFMPGAEYLNRGR